MIIKVRRQRTLPTNQILIKVNKERQRTLRTNKMRDMYTSCQTEEDYNQIIIIFQLRVKTPDGSLLSAIELPWLKKKSVIRFALEEPDDLYHYTST